MTISEIIAVQTQKTAKIKQVRLTVKQAITDGFLQLDDDDMIHLISPSIFFNYKEGNAAFQQRF